MEQFYCLSKSRLADTFLLSGKTFHYDRSGYNNLGERVVEIPVLYDFLSTVPSDARMLEVGNVLENYLHYYPSYTVVNNRQVVDKYELGSSVLNKDIRHLAPNNKYQAIISVSTVEHVGRQWPGAEKLEGCEAPLTAVAKIYDLLEPGGISFITFPFGELTQTDSLIQFNSDYLQLLFDKYGVPRDAVSIRFMKRTAIELVRLENRWRTGTRALWLEADEGEMSGVELDAPCPSGNGVAFLTMKKGAVRKSQRRQGSSLVYHSPALVGSVWDPHCTAGVAPDASGCFSSEACHSVLMFERQDTPAGTYSASIHTEVLIGTVVLDISAIVDEKVSQLHRESFTGVVLRSFAYQFSSPATRIRINWSCDSYCQFRVPVFNVRLAARDRTPTKRL